MVCAAQSLQEQARFDSMYHIWYTKDAGPRSGYRGSPAERTDVKNRIEKGRIGQSFDSFLKEQGRHQASTPQAIKRVIAYQLVAAMQEQKLSKTAFAKKLKTSRSQLDRLLDPDNAHVTLDALARAAKAVGRELQLQLR
jgi:antitoxin HicB